MISSINFKQAGLVTGALALTAVAGLAALRIGKAACNYFSAASAPAKTLTPAELSKAATEAMELAEQHEDPAKAEEAVELAKKAKQIVNNSSSGIITRPRLAAFVGLLASAGLFFANKTGLISLGNLASRVSNFRS